MKKINNTLSEKLNYIWFWRWEYSRRNNDSLEKLHKIIHCPDDIKIDVINDRAQGTYEDNIIGRDSVKEHSGIVGGFNVCFYNNDHSTEFYLDSDSILKALSEDTFKHIYPSPPVFSNYKSIKIMFLDKDEIIAMRDRQTAVIIGEEHGENSISSKRFGMIESLIVDSHCPIDLIVNEIKHYHASRRYLHADYKEKEIYDEILCEYMYNNSKVSLSRVSINDVLRGIGLWIFDYCHNNNCGGPTAIKALRKKGYLSKLNINDDDDRQFLRLYSNAQKCIKVTDVLPITSKS